MHSPPDSFDVYADVLEQATADAMRQWFTTDVDPAMRPAMVAAADPEDEQPLHLGALLGAVTAWLAVWDTEVAPVAEGLLAMRMDEALRGMGVSPAELTARSIDSPATRTALERLRGALQATRHAGAPAPDDGLEYLVLVPGWPEYVQNFARTRRNMVVGMPEALYRDLVTKMSAATRDGLDPWERIRLARSYLSWEDEGGYDQWITRASRIARTESNNLMNAADLQAARTEEQHTGDDMHKVWVATLDPRTRDTHFRLDGQRVPLGGKFMVGGHEADHPSDQRLPPHESINCVVGETKLGWAGQGVASSTRRPYVGTFVNLVTANGHDLTVTPNHPVLTPGGYVPAGELRPGEEVMGTPVASAPKVSDMPPRADEFHHALGQAGVRGRIVGGGMDFHGDIAEGDEIDVVRPDRDLWVDIHPAEGGSSPGDNPLIGVRHGAGALPSPGGRGVTLSPPPLARGSRNDGGGSAPGSVGGASERPPLVFPEPGHADTVGLGAGADPQPKFIKPADDSGATDTELARHLQNASSLGMEPVELIGVDFFTGRHDVYNLSTTDEWYTANGIALHNCRCTLMYVRADEDVPDDTDRQTERERSDGTTRDPQAEVRARGGRGVTRAGDNGQQTVTAAAQTGDTPMRKQWTGTLAPVGKPTGDGRIFDTDAELTFREFPLPLMFQRATSDGHDTAVIVGKITSATVDGGGVQAVGEFFDSAEATEAVTLVQEGVLRPSVDLADMVVEYELLDADGNAVDLDDDELDPDDIAGERMHIRAASIIAATLVAKPAFAEAKITIGDDTPAPAEDDTEAEEAALVASATALTEVPAFPADAFADPRLDGPTALTVTDDGRVYGHLAAWGTEHLSRPGITPPRSATGYALFHTSTVRADTGRLSVGRLTVGTGHADARASAHSTAEHYDNTGAAWAFVRAGEDQHGTWVAGVVNPDADPKDVRAGASAPLSGDWRNVGGNLELVAALSVNVGGFPVPRSYAATSGAELSLVASGVVRPRRRADELADAVAEGLRRHEQRKAEAELAKDAAFKEAGRLAATRRMAARVWAMEVNK